MDARRCRSSARRLLAVLVPIVVATLIGCGDDSDAPTRLFDGSLAGPPEITLEGVEGPAVLTRVRTEPVDGGVRSAAVATCLKQETGARRVRLAVVRTGATGESVTLVDAGRRNLFACDNSGGARERGRRWCGSSAGQLPGGRLRDPRLDVLCRMEDGRPIGFVWVQPFGATRYVVVREAEYDEVYEPAGGIPVRVATASGLGHPSLRATIAVSDHDSRGKLLRRYRLTAAPAG